MLDEDYEITKDDEDIEPVNYWEGCKKYSGIMNAMSGWLFGDVLHHYVHGIPIVLRGEAENGGDLRFAATSAWLINNNIANRFGTSQEEVLEYINHASECHDAACKEAYKRYLDIEGIMETGFIAGGEIGTKKIRLSSLFHGDRSNMILKRNNGWEDEIDALKPYFEWFNGKNKRNWIW